MSLHRLIAIIYLACMFVAHAGQNAAPSSHMVYNGREFPGRYPDKRSSGSEKW